MEKLRKVFEGSDEAGYIDPNLTEEENYYSYAYATGLNLEPVDRMNQVKPQVRDQPSSPPAPSPPPCFLIPDLWTGIKVWFGAITMTLLIIGVGYLLILYYTGKTIFKCVFYFMITLKVCEWKFIKESVFVYAGK